jgi:hypothetical protein
MIPKLYCRCLAYVIKKQQVYISLHLGFVVVAVQRTCDKGQGITNSKEQNRTDFTGTWFGTGSEISESVPFSS